MTEIWFTCPQCGLQLYFQDQNAHLCPRCGQQMQLGRFTLPPRPTVPMPPPTPSGSFPSMNGPQSPMSSPIPQPSGPLGEQPQVSGSLGPQPPQPTQPGPLPPAGWPPQPPMMPPRPPAPGSSGYFSQWFSRQSARRQMLLFFGGIFVFVLVFGGFGLVYGAINPPVGGSATATPGTVAQVTKPPSHPTHSKPSPTATATIDTTPSATPTPTATPTVTPTPRPTATPGPRPITSAIFGGKVDAFTAKYGQPSQIKGPGGVYTYTLADGSHVQMLIESNVSANDGTDHVTVLSINSADPGVIWDVNTCKQVLDTFMPPDAQYVKDVQIIEVEHIYVSATLAATFPASAFTDASGNRLPPGTFYTVFQGSLSGLGGCDIDLGE